MSESETAMELQTQGTALLSSSIDAQGILQHLDSLRKVVKEALVKGEDFDLIPGTKTPTLLQPGAEKLALGAMLAAHPKVEMVALGRGHREYTVTLDLVNREGSPVGQGQATCSTMESKYRYRYVSAPCSDCGAEGTIGKSKYPEQGAPPNSPKPWYCFPQKGGCGSTFAASIGEFKTSKQDNPDVADVWNTVLQMAIKRALVSTVKRTLALSGMFTMDLDDQPPAEPRKPVKTSKGGRKPRTRRDASKGAGKRQGQGPPQGQPDPPAEAYDDDAAAETHRSKPPTKMSPAAAAKLSAEAAEMGVDLEWAMVQVGFDGKLIDMPVAVLPRLKEKLQEMQGGES